jgi:hypothetical protein
VVKRADRRNARSALYLFLENKQGKATHDIQNLRRLFEIFVAAKHCGSLGPEDKQTLIQAIEQNLSAGADKPLGHLLAGSDLKKWLGLLLGDFPD